MYQGAYVKKRRKSKVRMNRATVLLMAVLMLIGVVAGSTVAYLIDKTSGVKNTFEYGKVSCDVGEIFDGTTKENVYVTNTGNVNAYIRATYVVNWVDEKGNILASNPDGYSYTITENPDGKWTKGADGYYYYTLPVAPQGKTDGSLLTCTVTEHPENPEYKLSVEILATAVQSVPEDAVKTAWGTGFSIDENGVLHVPTSN